MSSAALTTADAWRLDRQRMAIPAESAWPIKRGQLFDGVFPTAGAAVIAREATWRRLNDSACRSRLADSSRPL
jgi:hypothetical protein